jgi:hypothetical protein
VIGNMPQALGPALNLSGGVVPCSVGVFIGPRVLTMNVDFETPGPLITQRLIYIDGDIRQMTPADLHGKWHDFIGNPHLQLQGTRLILTGNYFTLIPCHKVGNAWQSSQALAEGPWPNGHRAFYEDSPGDSPGGRRLDQIITVM